MSDAHVGPISASEGYQLERSATLLKETVNENERANEMEVGVANERERSDGQAW